jgi:hypothetical protein
MQVQISLRCLALTNIAVLKSKASLELRFFWNIREIGLAFFFLKLRKEKTAVFLGQALEYFGF